MHKHIWWNTHIEGLHYTIMQLDKVFIYRDKGSAFSAAFNAHVSYNSQTSKIGNPFMGAISLCKRTPIGILTLEMLLGEYNTFFVTFAAFK